jgi:hypothetical protein
LPLTATIFERGGRSAHLSDEPLEQLATRFTGPRIGYGDGDAGDVGQRRRTAREVRVMGIES